MKNSLTDIETLLRAEDIEGLIGSGAPSDEYDSEASQITSAIVSLSTERQTEYQITHIISSVWSKSFNLQEHEIKQRLEAFKHIAHDICGS